MVAEGVETPEQLLLLRALGCQFAEDGWWASRSPWAALALPLFKPTLSAADPRGRAGQTFRCARGRSGAPPPAGTRSPMDGPISLAPQPLVDCFAPAMSSRGASSASRAHRAPADRPAGRRPPPRGGRSRSGQDHRGKARGAHRGADFHRIQFTPDLLPAGPSRARDLPPQEARFRKFHAGRSSTTWCSPTR